MSFLNWYCLKLPGRQLHIIKALWDFFLLQFLRDIHWFFRKLPAHFLSPWGENLESSHRMYGLISPSVPTLNIFMDKVLTQETLCPHQKNSKLIMPTFAWKKNNQGVHVRIRLFSFNLLLKTKNLIKTKVECYLRGAAGQPSTLGCYAHHQCACMCACLTSVVTELMTEGFDILKKGVNTGGLIFVLSFASDDDNNNSIYHEQTLGTQCLI